MLVAMRNSGMIGDERRLEWTELLRTSQERLEFPGRPTKSVPKPCSTAQAPRECAILRADEIAAKTSSRKETCCVTWTPSGGVLRR